MITIILVAILAFAVIRFAILFVYWIGLLVVMIGSWAAIAVIAALMPFAWLGDQWLNARRAPEEDEGFNIIINIVDDDEPRVLDLHPNTRGVHKIR